MPFVTLTVALLLSIFGAFFIVGGVQSRHGSLAWIGFFLIWLAIGFGYAAGRWS